MMRSPSVLLVSFYLSLPGVAHAVETAVAPVTFYLSLPGVAHAVETAVAPVTFKDEREALGILLTGFIIFIFVYFLPTTVAYTRNHQNSAAIAVLNLLLGWTILGWIVALVWSSTVVQPPYALE